MRPLIIKIDLNYLIFSHRECQLNKNDGSYPLIAKMNYITRYSHEARSTFLNTFEVKKIFNFFMIMTCNDYTWMVLFGLDSFFSLVRVQKMTSKKNSPPM